jgi:hypothetical protein
MTNKEGTGVREVSWLSKLSRERPDGSEIKDHVMTLDGDMFFTCPECMIWTVGFEIKPMHDRKRAGPANWKAVRNSMAAIGGIGVLLVEDSHGERFLLTKVRGPGSTIIDYDSEREGFNNNDIYDRLVCLHNDVISSGSHNEKCRTTARENGWDGSTGWDKARNTYQPWDET